MGKFPDATFPLTYEMDQDHTFRTRIASIASVVPQLADPPPVDMCVWCAFRLVACTAAFNKTAATCGTDVTLTLSVIVDAPLPIQLSRIAVVFTDPSLNLYGLRRIAVFLTTMPASSVSHWCVYVCVCWQGGDGFGTAADPAQPGSGHSVHGHQPPRGGHGDCQCGV